MREIEPAFAVTTEARKKPISTISCTIIGGVLGGFISSICLFDPVSLFIYLPALTLLKFTGQSLGSPPYLRGVPDYATLSFLIFNTVFYAIIGGFVGGFIGGLRNRRYRKLVRENYCSKCEYCLIGNESGTCPECGTPIPNYKRPINQKSDDGS